MRALVTGLAVAAVLALSGAVAHADPYFTGPPPMPGACNPGFYAVNGYGGWYGPNYYAQPPFAPFNGMLAIPQCNGGGAAEGPYGPGGPKNFATHPFARSPRDFFMFGQTYNDCAY
jgi:hypothetical protein